MGRPKKKSDYDSRTEVQKQMNEVVAYFGMNYDDRNPISDKSVSLRDVADHFGITLLKARRILVLLAFIPLKSVAGYRNYIKPGKASRRSRRSRGYRVLP